ncbi:MAG: hypothetical protein L0K63_10690 [Yaniella sp.]|nr:hypothetical protein [Yaniella sp.]
MTEESSESTNALSRHKQPQSPTADTELSDSPAPQDESDSAAPEATNGTDASSALERLKNSQSSSAPATTAEDTDDHEAPALSEVPATERKTSRAPKEDKWTLRDKFNAWLDSFKGPTQEDIEQAIANTPDRLQARWKKLQDDRRAVRLAEERSKQLAAEVEEARLALEEQWERESERMAELERQHAIDARRRQQERETEALLRAARELESDDVPAPQNRPMLQQDDEYLSDDELFERARQNLPEWQRLNRIVYKARSIESQTPAPALPKTEEDLEDDAEVVLPFRKPVTDDPDPQQLDGFRRITLTMSWVLFVVVGLVSLGWVGPWPSMIEAHDGLYSGSTSLMSMAFWHVAAWPILWVGMLLYTSYQWAPSQYSAVRNRTTAWYVSNAMLLAVGAKLLAHFQDWGLEVLASIAASVLLVRAVGSLNRYTERTVKERFLVDMPIGLFTGWMMIFSVTTVFTALASHNLSDLLWIPEIIWAILVILVLLVILSRLTLTGRGRMSIAIGFGFGMIAIAGSRLFGANPSFIIVGVALLGLFVIIAATENRRYQIATAEKQALEYLVYADEED